jgi:hypothetical protein
VATTIEDLKKSHKLVNDGFYVSHRIYVEKIPEKYTIEPIKTRKTGGRDIETGKNIRNLNELKHLFLTVQY